MIKGTITVPIDKNAEHDLDYNRAKSNQLIELQLSEREFYQLWNEGVFDLINKIADSNIDDFEDSSIADVAVMRNVISKLDKQKTTNPNVKALRDLFQKAIDYGTGVYFYF